jgi:hypothetical protein
LSHTPKRNGRARFRFALVAAILGLLILSLAVWSWPRHSSDSVNPDLPPTVPAPAVTVAPPEVPVHLGSGLNATDPDLVGIDRQLLAGAGAPLPSLDQPVDTESAENGPEAEGSGAAGPVVAPINPSGPPNSVDSRLAQKKRKRRRIGVSVAFILGAGSFVAAELLQGSSGSNSAPPSGVSPPGGGPVGDGPLPLPQPPVSPPRPPRRPPKEPGSGGGSQNPPPSSGPGPGSGGGGGGTGSGNQPPTGSSGNGSPNPPPGQSPVTGTGSGGSGTNPPSEPTSPGGGNTPIPPISSNPNPPSGSPNPPSLVIPTPPTVNVVPEPDFRALLFLGIAAIGAVRWQRSRRG